MTEKAAATREAESGRDYAERDELLKVEQQVMELRAADVRDRVMGRTFGNVTAATTAAEDAPPQDETDTALSLLTTASFYRPPITVAEATRCFKDKAGGGAAAAGDGGGVADGSPDNNNDDDDDDDLFVGLDGWA